MKNINLINYHIYKLVKNRELPINWIENLIILTNNFIKTLLEVFFKKNWEK